MTKQIITTDAPPAHAILSASGSKKWLTCTPSARAEQAFKDEGSEFAEEGTYAHQVFAQRLQRELGLPEVPPDDALRDKWDNLELQDYVEMAVQRALELIGEAYTYCVDPVILVEQKLDFSPWVPEGFGTGDLVIITDDKVVVADLKYGKGIMVGVEENSQMRLYGLGAYNVLSHLYDMKAVTMKVLQPRLDNWAEDQMTVEALLAWGVEYVRPRAYLAWDGKGELVPGSHCHDSFCRARFTCAARAEQGLALANAEFALLEPELLSEAQLLEVLAKGDAVSRWIADVQEFMLREAEGGKAIAGWKLVEGRSNRRYKDQDAVAAKLLKNGMATDDIFEKKLLGITAMEKVLGKKDFTALLGELVEKPEGKLTLVPESDKRPAKGPGSEFQIDRD